MSAGGKLILHTSVTHEHCETLAEVFAYLTPEGWRIPLWLTLLNGSALGVTEFHWPLRPYWGGEAAGAAVKSIST